MPPPAASGGPSALPTEANCARGAGAPLCGRDTAALAKRDALLNPRPVVPSPPPAAGRLPGGSAWPVRSSRSKGNRAPGVLQAVLRFPARSGRTPSGGPTARSRGAPLTGSGRRQPLSAARPASPPRLTNPGSSAKLPSSSESRLDCTSPPPVFRLSAVLLRNIPVRKQHEDG